jgi:hypothetical protein
VYPKEFLFLASNVFQEMSGAKVSLEDNGTEINILSSWDLVWSAKWRSASGYKSISQFYAEEMEKENKILQNKISLLGCS